MAEATDTGSPNRQQTRYTETSVAPCYSFLRAGGPQDLHAERT